MKFVLMVAGVLFGFLLGVYSGQEKVMKYESLSKRAISQTNECLVLLEKTDALADELNVLTNRLAQ